VLGLGLLARWGWQLTALLAGTAGCMAAAGAVGAFLADLLLNALAQGRLKRARMRAAAAHYARWASAAEPEPGLLRTMDVNYKGQRLEIRWLEDDQPSARAYRACLVELVRTAQDVWRHSSEEPRRTGLTEQDLVGEGRMFERKRDYLKAIRVLADMQLVQRENGLPTRLADGWSYARAMSYLREQAPLPDLPDPPPLWNSVKAREKRPPESPGDPAAGAQAV
jgi:hypothetical protein